MSIESSKTSHDPQKVNFNYSSLALPEREKTFPCKRLSFVLPSNKLEYSRDLLPFELLYCDIQNQDIGRYCRLE